jgi:hypothetical protein
MSNPITAIRIHISEYRSLTVQARSPDRDIEVMDNRRTIREASLVQDVNVARESGDFGMCEFR